MRRIALAILLFGAVTGAGFAAAYDDFARGMSDNMRGDHDGAIAAFTAALGDGDLSPGLLPQAYRGRAVAYLDARRCAPALDDIEAALKLRPGDGDLVTTHAVAAICLDKLDVALADYGRLIDTKFSPDVYRWRGHLRWRMGDFAGAAEDFAALVPLRKKDAYAVLWLEMARVRAGSFDPVVARSDARPFDDDEWPGALLALYAGRVKPGDIAPAAALGKPEALVGQQCEADFYLGEWWLARADVVSAKPLLQRAADACPRNFVEYGQARIELGRIK